MKVEYLETFNFTGAFRGMRNPLESWRQNDTYVYTYQNALHPMSSFQSENYQIMYYIGSDAVCVRLGENDLALAQKLIKAGSDHRKFMRQILVSMDIVAPIYWWKEMDTYKVATVRNSCSTMHKLATTPITRDCFVFDSELDFIESQGQIGIPAHGTQYNTTFSDSVDTIIRICEGLRKSYIETKDKRYWRALVELLPESWLQRSTWTGNYEIIYNIINSREGHKLVEWHYFISKMRDLPYSTELLFGGLKNGKERIV